MTNLMSSSCKAFSKVFVFLGLLYLGIFSVSVPLGLVNSFLIHSQDNKVSFATFVKALTDFRSIPLPRYLEELLVSVNGKGDLPSTSTFFLQN